MLDQYLIKGSWPRAILVSLDEPLASVLWPRGCYGGRCEIVSVLGNYCKRPFFGTKDGVGLRIDMQFNGVQIVPAGWLMLWLQSD